MKTVLVTGFEPFGGDAANPSEDVARALHGRTIAEHDVTGAVLPCAFGAAVAELKRQMQRTRPAIVMCLGLAGGRAAVTPERVAINVDDARIPDNAGAQPVDQPIVRGGPAAYWTKLPIKAIVVAIHRRGIAAEVSQTAGTFVCNHVFYALMHELRRKRSVRGGFIHIPFLPEQAPPGVPGMPLATMIDAIAVAVEVTITAKRDLIVPGGREA